MRATPRETPSRRDINEKLNGKDAGATVLEVTFAPGQADVPHRHAGQGTFAPGETVYEPSGSLHRVARNPSGKARTRLLATMLHPRDAREATVPEKAKK